MVLYIKFCVFNPKPATLLTDVTSGSSAVLGNYKIQREECKLQLLHTVHMSIYFTFF